MTCSKSRSQVQTSLASSGTCKLSCQRCTYLLQYVGKQGRIRQAAAPVETRVTWICCSAGAKPDISRHSLTRMPSYLALPALTTVAYPALWTVCSPLSHTLRMPSYRALSALTTVACPALRTVLVIPHRRHGARGCELAPWLDAPLCCPPAQGIPSPYGPGAQLHD